MQELADLCRKHKVRLQCDQFDGITFVETEDRKHDLAYFGIEFPAEDGRWELGALMKSETRHVK